MSEPEIEIPGDTLSPPLRQGPGHRLRMARERKGLDLATVAERLHLPARLVEAIENDDYSQLPGSVFAQGYLRNYARLVDEPVEEVLQSFGSVRPAEEYKPALRQFQAPMKASQVNSSHGLIRTITWLIILALAALLVVWWRGYITLPVPMLGETTDEPAAPVATWQDSPIPVVPLTPGEPEDAGTVTPAIAPVVSEPPAEPEAGIPLELSTEAGLPENEPQAATGEQPDSLEAEREPGPGAGGGNDIVLNFTSPCWVDIRDSAGQKVLYGGVGAGESHTLTGQPPYQVVLGDSTAVEVTVGGRPFDTSAHARGRVARFLLDPEKAVSAAEGNRD